MSTKMQSSRRRFLRHALGSAAACSLAAFSSAKENTSRDAIIDTDVYFGHCPHQSLPSEDLSSLIAILRRNNVTQAWVGCFDGLFHKDVAAVNQ
jgi:uncharacterized protein